MTVEYGGQGGSYSNANLVLNASPTIMNSTIRNSAGSGVYATGQSSNSVIVNSNITANKWGVYASSSNLYVMYNNIYANTTAGVWNATTSPDVDARENWWGVATGPTYTGNPGGRGDSISDHVLYNPWLAQPIGNNLSITETRGMPNALNANGGYITFTALLSTSATWTITISDGNRNAVNTYTGSGTTIKQKWYGVDSQSVKVPDGSYYYRIDAQDPSSGASASSPEGLLMVSSVVPIVYMDPPVDNQMFPGGTTLNITGRVSDTVDFKNYTLDYGVGANPVSWTTLKTASTPVNDSLIYAWNTSALTGALYTLRLTVNDNAGNVVVDTARVRLFRMQNLAVSQTYISPNGDGLQDATTVSATLNFPCVWTLTLKDSAGSAVKTYTGTSTTLSQVWDGTNDAGSVVADGIYTYQIAAVSSETGIQVIPLTGTIIVDATIPAALISSPVANTILSGSVLITGSASDANISTYKVEYGPSAGAGPWTLINSSVTSVSSGSIATWVTNDPSLPSPIPNGNYLIRLTVTDKAGNSLVSSVPVILNDLQISNVGISATAINTFAAESTSIFFTVNDPATVTLKVIPEKLGPTGAPIYQTPRNCTVAGAYFFTWNGQDNAGNTVPDEAYLYILEASDGIKTYVYSLPAPTGTGSVSCTHSTFSAYKNNPMTISYSVPQPERVTINISWGPENFTIVNNVPCNTGAYTFNWNGLDPNGMALDSGAFVTCSTSSLIRANHIITTGDTPLVSGLTSDPYALSFSYGQFTKISYTLSRDALVTVSIVSNSGATVATLISNVLQTSGAAHEIEWNGIDPGDASGKTLMLPAEGAYTLTVQAVNPVTGSSSTARGQVTLSY